MSRSDMFLKAVGQRSGVILGEANDKQFAGQIDVVDWSWGMTAPTAVGGTRTGRTQLGELKLVKQADKASTSLMSVMLHNESLTTVVLSVRKAGGAQMPYFVVTLTDARVVAYGVQSELSAEGAPVLTERLSLAYKSINIDYSVQTDKGKAQSTSNFMASAAPE